MAATPLVLFVVAIVVGVVIGDSAGFLYDVAGNWALVLAFGSVLFVPSMLLTAYGAYLLPQPPVFGRVVATVGLALPAAFLPLILVGLVDSVITDRSDWPDDGTSWAPKLSTAGTIVATTPFVLLSVAAMYGIWLVWSRRPVPATTPAVTP